MIALPPGFLHRPIAHRALHDKGAGRPENSLAAIRAAIGAGYGIEIDLQLSADGRAMVFHDYDLKRLTGQPGAIRQRSAAELGAMPLLGGNEGIPTFDRVLEEVKGRVPLLVEIKDQDGALGPDVGQLETEVAKCLAAYRGPVAVMSFNPHAIAALASAAPAIPRGLTTCAFTAGDWPLVPAATRERLAGIPDYHRVGASFISHDAEDLESPQVARIHALGGHVLCWTIRSAKDEQAARRIAENVTFEGYAAAIPCA